MDEGPFRVAIVKVLVLSAFGVEFLQPISKNTNTNNNKDFPGMFPNISAKLSNSWNFLIILAGE